jgi:hypothetical protein
MLTDEDMKTLVEILMTTNKPIHTLNLSGFHKPKKIGTQGMKYLSDAVKCNNTITVLVLSGRNLF